MDWAAALVVVRADAHEDLVVRTRPTRMRTPAVPARRVHTFLFLF